MSSCPNMRRFLGRAAIDRHKRLQARRNIIWLVEGVKKRFR